MSDEENIQRQTIEFGGKHILFMNRRHRQLIKWGVMDLPVGYKIIMQRGKRFSIYKDSKYEEQLNKEIQQPGRGKEEREKDWA